MKIACRAVDTGPIAHLRSSGGMPSGPAARPLRSLRMAETTSSREGASTGVSGSTVVLSASVSSSSLWMPGGWLSAASKCSRHRHRVSSKEAHGDPRLLYLPVTHSLSLRYDTLDHLYLYYIQVLLYYLLTMSLAFNPLMPVFAAICTFTAIILTGNPLTVTQPQV